MKKETKKIEKELRELFNEFDNDILCVSDFDIKTSEHNIPITHITNGSTDNDFTIGIWNGDPENDDYAEELIINEDERVNIYKEINELF